MKKGLNLGSGYIIFQQESTFFFNVDIEPLPGVDIVHDLNIFPYPFEDESIDIILMYDVLEHLDNPIDVLQECWRILKKDGKVCLKVVYWNNYNTFSDPQHKHGFTEKYFDFFIGVRRKYYMKHHFLSKKIKHVFTPEATERYGHNIKSLLKKAFFHCNIIESLDVTLTK